MSTQQIIFRLPHVDHPDALLSLEVADHGPVTVVTVGGELDMATMHLFTERVDEVLRRAPLRLVLDLAELTFFCADGLRALQHARTAAAAIACDLILRDPSPGTLKVLTLTATIGQFHIAVTPT